MPFRFSLETVLRFRKSIERAEEIALHKIVQGIASARVELEQIEAQQKALRAQRDGALARPLPAIHLQELTEREQLLAGNAEPLRRRIQELERRRIEQLAIFQAAQQNREVLSEMRRQKHDSYERQQRRLEQKTLDELFLARFKDDD